MDGSEERGVEVVCVLEPCGTLIGWVSQHTIDHLSRSVCPALASACRRPGGDFRSGTVAPVRGFLLSGQVLTPN